MERVTLEGLLDAYNEDQPLDPSTYEAVVSDPRLILKEGRAPSLMAGMTVVDGPEQNSGVSPMERRVYAHFPLGGYDRMKDGGAFVKRRLANFLTACGIELENEMDFPDPNELAEMVRDKHVLIKTSIKEPDEYNPEPSTEVRRYMKA